MADENTSPYVLHILLGIEMVGYGILISFASNLIFRNNGDEIGTI